MEWRRLTRTEVAREDPLVGAASTSSVCVMSMRGSQSAPSSDPAAIAQHGRAPSDNLLARPLSLRELHYVLYLMCTSPLTPIPESITSTAVSKKSCMIARARTLQEGCDASADGGPAVLTGEEAGLDAHLG